MDKGIDPMGLHIGMRKVYNRYRLPMIVTENGMAYSETLGPDARSMIPTASNTSKSTSNSWPS